VHTIGFIATVCGIEFLSPVFQEVLIKSHLGSLKNIIGKMPHHSEYIIVELDKLEKMELLP
jgi:hypothetical protein